MSEPGGVQKNTAYGVFVQACWAQHKRQYPDEFIHKEIEEFNKQCSVWWYNLTQQERDKFQEIADRSNAQQATVSQTAQTYTVQATTSDVHTQPGVVNVVQTQPNPTGSGGIPTFGSSFAYSDYGLQQGTSAQVVNAVVDNGGTVLHYSTNTGNNAPAPAPQVQHKPPTKANQKPMKDPNAPKKPLSAYFLFCQDEREKVKADNPQYSILEVAKELGRRWASIDPGLKQGYEQRYQAAKKIFDQEMPQKKKKDPNAPKQPLSSYFIFSEKERQKIKVDSPNIPLTELGKELGRRWAKIDPGLKAKFQGQAEEARQRYDVDMAAYRQGTFVRPGQEDKSTNNQNQASPAPAPSSSSYQPAQEIRVSQQSLANGLPTDYSNIQFKT